MAGQAGIGSRGNRPALTLLVRSYCSGSFRLAVQYTRGAVRGEPKTTAVFLNARGDVMTRSGFEYILEKHVRTAVFSVFETDILAFGRSGARIIGLTSYAPDAAWAGALAAEHAIVSARTALATAFRG